MTGYKEFIEVIETHGNEATVESIGLERPIAHEGRRIKCVLVFPDGFQSTFHSYEGGDVQIFGNYLIHDPFEPKLRARLVDLDPEGYCAAILLF